MLTFNLPLQGTLREQPSTHASDTLVGSPIGEHLQVGQKVAGVFR